MALGAFEETTLTSLGVPQALPATLQCPLEVAVHARSAPFAGWRAIRRTYAPSHHHARGFQRYYIYQCCCMSLTVSRCDITHCAYHLLFCMCVGATLSLLAWYDEKPGHPLSSLNSTFFSIIRKVKTAAEGFSKSRVRCPTVIYW